MFEPGSWKTGFMGGGEPHVFLLTFLMGFFLLVTLIPISWFLPPVLIVAALLSLVVTVFFFTRPEVSLLLFFALRATLDILWWLPASVGSLNVSELFSGAVASLAMVAFFFNIRRMDWNPNYPLFLLYILTMAIASLRGLDIRDGAEILARYLSTFFLMFLMAEYFSTEKARKGVILLVWVVGFVPILVSLYHLAAGQMQEYSLAGLPRLKGGYKNLHNHALMMMYFSIMGTWWFFQVRQRTWRILVGIVTAITLGIVYLTYVRTAWIGYAFFVATYLVLEGRWRLLLLMCAVGAVGIASNSVVQGRFYDFVSIFEDRVDLDVNGLGSDRVGIWLTALKNWSHFPLADRAIGLGMSQQQSLTAEYVHMSRIDWIDVHNDYLTILFQMGPIATLCYVGMQIQVFRYAWKLRCVSKDPFWRAFGTLMIGLNVVHFWSNGISNAFVTRTTIGWYFWGLAGLMLGQYRDIVLTLPAPWSWLPRRPAERR